MRGGQASFGIGNLDRPGFGVPQVEPYCCFRLWVIQTVNPGRFPKWPNFEDSRWFDSDSQPLLDQFLVVLVWGWGGGLLQSQCSLVVKAPVA